MHAIFSSALTTLNTVVITDWQHDRHTEIQYVCLATIERRLDYALHYQLAICTPHHRINLLVGYRQFGHMTCKIVPEMTYNVSSGTLSLYTTTIGSAIQ